MNVTMAAETARGVSRRATYPWQLHKWARGAGSGERCDMSTLTLPRRRFLLVVAGLSLSALAGCRPHTSQPIANPRAPTPPSQSTPPARIRFGADVLLDHPALLRNHRVGLITNQTGRSADGQRTVDLLYARNDMSLLALFSPEHGFAGGAAPGDSVAKQPRHPN
jgi:Protein of unknown function (DUF1343)